MGRRHGHARDDKPQQETLGLLTTVGSRRKSREAALKILYQVDLIVDETAESKLDDYFLENPSEVKRRDFVELLVNGVCQNRPEIDRKLTQALKNWELSRLGYIERAILRLGAFEIAYQSDIPDRVAIDEAIELAKAYCELESAGLINGALDYIMNNKDSGNSGDEPGSQD